uniref:Uncharacterized protein n=1 Tax=Anabas testudineus TaxID=64144 RepID=A0A3Q1K0X8_ANATE
MSSPPEFKTPTRISRSKVVHGFCGESPHNDSDFQQDIVWDATSPSPNRLGKRGKKHQAGAVDISEIVSRIAPKHGRPKVAEPTLQQWIGDSATIPCTPDVQIPKPKKKPNGVDDLLKLAKQFDLNMFRQDEEEVEDMHHQTAAGTDVRVNQHVEDDLDFLFDGPTQHVSENLSQVSSAQPSQFKPSTTLTSGELPSHGPTSMASTTSPKDTSHNDEFEDDWENDDLLNDSLVFEITQNPQNFVAPKHSSTQKPGSEMKYQTPAKVPVRGGVSLHQSDVSKVEKENRRQRTTFKLESNPNLSETDKWTNLKVDSSSDKDKATQQTRFSSSKCFSVEPGSQHTWQTCQLNSGPQTSQFYQRTSAASTMSASNTAVTQTTPKEPQVMSSNSTAPAVCDFLDQDLDSFFSSDLVWDDLADDDLLCEMCEDVENQIQSADNVSIKQTLPDVQVSKQRAALQPSNRTWANRTQRAVMQPSCLNYSLFYFSFSPSQIHLFYFSLSQILLFYFVLLQPVSDPPVLLQPVSDPPVLLCSTSARLRSSCSTSARFPGDVNVSLENVFEVKLAFRRESFQRLNRHQPVNVLCDWMGIINGVRRESVGGSFRVQCSSQVTPFHLQVSVGCSGEGDPL